MSYRSQLNYLLSTLPEAVKREHLKKNIPVYIYIDGKKIAIYPKKRKKFKKNSPDNQ